MKFQNLFKMAAGASFVLAGLFSAQSFAQVVRGKHIILTLHGVRGTEKSFGSFHSIIKDHLEKVDPGFTVSTINYTYKTGQLDHHPANMKNGINEAILKEAGGNLGNNDKISVIGYSMGGQVMAHWYFNTIFDQKYSRIAEKTENLIGLGAPFWGSLNANLGKDLIPQLGFDLDNFANLIQMSGNELRSLSAVSEAVGDLRSKMIEWRMNPSLRSRFNPKIFSIAGIMPCVNQMVPDRAGCNDFKSDITKIANENIALNMLFSGLTRWETDMMVIVPSARLDFIYYKDQKDGLGNVPSSQFVNMEDEKEAASRFLTIDTMHATDLAVIEGKENPFYDIVIVPQKCLDPKKCDQKSYKYLFEALAGCKKAGNTCNRQAYQQMEDDLFAGGRSEPKNREETWLEDWSVSKQLHGFVIEMTLNLPEGFHFPSGKTLNTENLFRYIRFNFDQNPYLDIPGSSLDFLQKVLPQRATWNGTARTSNPEVAKIQVGRSYQLKSRQVEVVYDTEGYAKSVRIGIMGRFIPGSKIDYNNEHDRARFIEALWSGKVVAPMTVGLPGLKARDVYAVVKPTSSTFIELNLSQDSSK